MSAGSIKSGERLDDAAGRRARNGGRLYAWFALVAGFTIFAGFARTLYADATVLPREFWPAST